MSDSEPKIPVLPTLMTAGNILCGYVAILLIFDGKHNDDPSRYHYAILAILTACIFDALDGRVARMGGQESPFGRELDSLADIVSFGVAPAMLVHDIVLKDLDQPRGAGWLISCIYLVCGAMRLARFNCIAAMDVKSTSKNFQGCPIPAAAGVISSITLVIIWWEGKERAIGNMKYGLAVLMLLLAFIMVSKVEYPSFKSVNWRTQRSFNAVLISIFAIAATVMWWQVMPAILFVSYLIYPLAVRPWISRRLRREIEVEQEVPSDEDEPEDPALLDDESRKTTESVADTQPQI